MRKVHDRARVLLWIGRAVVLRSSYRGIEAGRGEVAWCLLLGSLAFYWLKRSPSATR